VSSIIVGERPSAWSAHLVLVFLFGGIAGAAVTLLAAAVSSATPPHSEPTARLSGCAARPGEHCECWPEGALP